VQIVYSQKTGKKSEKPVTITGKVMNKDKIPITGAVIYIDNIRTSNITKSDGSYKIKVSSSVINLEIRSSEYGNCETAINGQTKINFTLNGDNSQASIPGPGDKVNGVIVSSIDNINPLEVRSIKVLKGSAAAIYGVGGTNGVISIDLVNGSEKNK